MKSNSKLDQNNLIYTLLCACKNEEDDINLLIESIKKIDYEFNAFEVLFADDSTDNTCTIISDLLIESKLNWRIIKCDNEGCCDARNKAILQSKGKYIVFLTADTILKSDYLRLLDKFKYNYEIIMPESSCLLPEERHTIYEKYSQSLHRILIENLNKKSTKPLTSQGYCVKKNEAIDSGLITTPPKGAKNYCNDFTLVDKMLNRKYTYTFESELLVFHKQPDNFNQFFKEKILRGKMSRRKKIYEKNLSKEFIFIISLARLFLNIIKFPYVLINVFKLSLNFNDVSFKPFLLLNLVDFFAFFIGESFG